MTIPTGVINRTNLNTDFGNVNDALIMPQLTRDFSVEFTVINGTTTTDLTRRTLEFVPQDDCQLVHLRMSLWNSSTTSRTVTATLIPPVATLADGVTTIQLDEYFYNNTISLTDTTIVTAEKATRVAFNSATRPYYTLLRGFRYKLVLTFATSGVMVKAVASLQLRSDWRRG